MESLFQSKPRFTKSATSHIQKLIQRLLPISFFLSFPELQNDIIKQHIPALPVAVLEQSLSKFHSKNTRSISIWCHFYFLFLILYLISFIYLFSLIILNIPPDIIRLPAFCFSRFYSHHKEPPSLLFRRYMIWRDVTSG